MKYNKQPISITDQISQLMNRGLIIDDEDVARRTLSIISYFRFANYLRPFEGVKTNHVFKPDNNVKTEIVNLLGKYPIVDKTAIGIPTGWKMNALWR